MIIQTPGGLGDAVYCYPIIKRYASYYKVTVMTKYREVFRHLDVKFADVGTPQIRLTYNNRRRSDCTQYQDILDNAGLLSIPFVFDWQEAFRPFVPAGKKICVVKEPCAAHMHKSAGQFHATPDPVAMQQFIDDHSEYYYVSVGKGEKFLRRLSGIDLDLNDCLDVPQLISLVNGADAVITQVGHLVPIAQGLKKPLRVFYPAKPDKKMSCLSHKKIWIDGTSPAIP